MSQMYETLSKLFVVVPVLEDWLHLVIEGNLRIYIGQYFVIWIILNWNSFGYT